MKALLLNGPPRSGKDTIGRMLWAMAPDLGLVCGKFADPIVRFMSAVFSVDMRRDDLKDIPDNSLLGKTPREVAIAYSERFCKPLFGESYFGGEAVELLKRMETFGQQMVVFTDSGFVSEAIPVLDHLGAANVLKVTLTRPGCSFVNDSRDHWTHLSIPELRFHNRMPTLDGLRDQLELELLPKVREWAAR